MRYNEKLAAEVLDLERQLIVVGLQLKEFKDKLNPLAESLAELVIDGVPDDLAGFGDKEDDARRAVELDIAIYYKEMRLRGIKKEYKAKVRDLVATVRDSPQMSVEDFAKPQVPDAPNEKPAKAKPAKKRPWKKYKCLGCGLVTNTGRKPKKCPECGGPSFEKISGEASK